MKIKPSIFYYAALGLVFALIATQSVSAQEIGFIESIRGLADLVRPENRGVGLALAAMLGVFDGLNVCSLTLVAVFVGYLLVHIHDRKRALKIGFVFGSSIFVSYFLIGAFLGSYMNQLLSWSGYVTVSKDLRLALVIVLLISGIFRIFSYFYTGKAIFGFKEKTEKNFFNSVKVLDLPMAALLGVASIIFLIPCSMPIYVSSVAVLASVFTLWQTLIFVAVYSLMFTMPLLVVMAFVLRAESIARHSEIHSEKYRFLKLIKGALLILAAYLVYKL